MTKVLEGKKGLVVGIANDHSIAWGIAKCLHEEGASMYLTYQNDSIKKRVEPLSQKINCLGIMPCDVSDTASLESVRDGMKDNIDFLSMPLPTLIKMNYPVNIFIQQKIIF